jgi:uncharacterized protein YkwD
MWLMRPASSRVARVAPSGAALLVAFASAACGAAVNPSGPAKLGEALAFAAAAAAVQVAQSVAEQNARNSAPIAHASGLNVSTQCDNDGQYGCVNVAPGSANDGRASGDEPDMSDDDARDYVLGYVNGVRRLNGAAPVLRDPSLDAFAQAASVELSLDHIADQHLAAHARELRGASGEVQGSPDGSSPAPLQEQIAAVLLRAMNEGPGGAHHDTILRPDWRRLGVGIDRRDGRMYFTIDFASDSPG